MLSAFLVGEDLEVLRVSDLLVRVDIDPNSHLRSSPCNGCTKTQRESLVRFTGWPVHT
jgi:hypothetical protein